MPVFELIKADFHSLSSFNGPLSNSHLKLEFNSSWRGWCSKHEIIGAVGEGGGNGIGEKEYVI